jgi:hypothetical protein
MNEWESVDRRPCLLSLALGAMGGFVTASGRLTGKPIEGQTTLASARLQARSVASKST